MGRTYRVNHLKMNRCEGVFVNPQIGHYAFVPEMGFIAGYFPMPPSSTSGIVNVGENIRKARVILEDGIYAGEPRERNIKNSSEMFPVLIDRNEGIVVLNNKYRLGENREPLGTEIHYVDEEIIAKISTLPTNFPVELKKPFNGTLNGLLDVLCLTNLTFGTRARIFCERLRRR